MEANFAFYPTLLDSYRYYLDNIEDERNFHDLIDKINRVKKETTEEQSKGILFESLVNDLIDGIVVDSDQFDNDLLAKISGKLSKSIGKQVFKETIIETKYGKVKIYGIFDYEFTEMIADLKTTTNYKSCKYINNFQHKFISLINWSIPYFSYVVTDFKHMFIETYKLDNKVRENSIKEVENFIEFLQIHSSLITDHKIFNKL